MERYCGGSSSRGRWEWFWELTGKVWSCRDSSRSSSRISDSTKGSSRGRCKDITRDRCKDITRNNSKIRNTTCKEAT